MDSPIADLNFEILWALLDAFIRLFLFNQETHPGAQFVGFLPNDSVKGTFDHPKVIRRLDYTEKQVIETGLIVKIWKGGAGRESRQKGIQFFAKPDMIDS